MDQRQPPADPTEGMAEAARQFLERQAKALVQFCQQPALLQRCLWLAGLHQPGDNQRLRLCSRPATGPYQVSGQPLQGTYSLVAIDDDELAVVSFRHHHNRYLLSHFRQRGQQSALLFRVGQPQSLVTQLELMKLQFHRLVLSYPKKRERSATIAAYLHSLFF